MVLPKYKYQTVTGLYADYFAPYQKIYEGTKLIKIDKVEHLSICPPKVTPQYLVNKIYYKRKFLKKIKMVEIEKTNETM